MKVRKQRTYSEFAMDAEFAILPVVHRESSEANVQHSLLWVRLSNACVQAGVPSSHMAQLVRFPIRQKNQWKLISRGCFIFVST